MLYIHTGLHIPDTDRCLSICSAIRLSNIYDLRGGKNYQNIYDIQYDNNNNNKKIIKR